MAKLTYEQMQDLARQVDQDLLDDIDLYMRLEPGRVQLDDWYTPEELRRIADAIEELAKRVKAAENG